MKKLSNVRVVITSITLAVWLIALSVGSGLTTGAAPAVFQDGAAIYAEKCAKCHNADGRGAEKQKKNGVQDFTAAKWQKTNTNAKITAAINNGKGDYMPAWKGKLKPAEVTALVKHIRSFKK